MKIRQLAAAIAGTYWCEFVWADSSFWEGSGPVWLYYSLHATPILIIATRGLLRKFSFVSVIVSSLLMGAISMLSFVLEGSSVWVFHSLVPLWGIVLAINLVAFVLPIWTSSPKSANGTDASAL